MFGINATADATNRLAVQSDASLFNNAGKGHQIKLNKATTGDTVSFLFQTGWSGRAEVGATGDDKLHFKVSPDGSTWREGLIIDGAAYISLGGVTAPYVDNSYTLGNSTRRWSAIYAANGTIQTSDARDKDLVGPLSSASGLVDTIEPVLFRWKVGGNVQNDDGTVAEIPGTRIHAGFIAQEIKAAMDAQHLDFGAWGLDDKNDPTSRQWTRPDQLIAVLWAALRETRAELHALSSRVTG
ncbi:hypothetical protein GJW-30_1_01489 [Variibacter gotjawalensis]|uniref:Peptidase S74 domain-containing protein n=1 Tax=Variibacter gotjawalensis TaxID=1333996 RepID=A0A0S3PSM6_9BRAD|nr:tail fiber domain-containing protein [Variibacter gotjawalensis]NIK49275.1 hypothetical protein [Variibacter gotjawalensis]RZS51126.1 endosialidase-like protein [Variibacter gotjawalensis]BAT58961.1 hypothetical protein GJW-30_1_01489 [Variibacter gotjawalensis]